jgi:hypothetical protein
MLTVAIAIALIVVAGDRIAKMLGFVIAFAFNVALILFAAALRLTIKG